MNNDASQSTIRQSKNAYLKEQFQKALTDTGYELLPEDEVIAEAFLNTEEHVSLEDLVEMVKDQCPEIDTTFARRTMRLLCDLGIAQQVRLNDRMVYEHLHLSLHHDHMICVRCGKIEEFKSSLIEQAQRDECKAKGIKPLMHKLEIRGICQACSAESPATRPLSSCLGGERVQVDHVLGGHGMRQRLMAMGLVSGTPMRVLSNQGPVTVEIRNSRVALGRGQASRVIVKNSEE